MKYALSGLNQSTSYVMSWSMPFLIFSTFVIQTKSEDILSCYYILTKILEFLKTNNENDEKQS